MTDKEGQYWADYIGELAELMGLKDWAIEVNETPINVPEQNAHMECVYGRRLGVLRLNVAWPARKPEAQRQSLVHELVHCHLDALCQLVESDIQGVLGQQAYDLLFKAHRRTLEYAVNDIARAWAASLPLPKPPKDKA